MPGMWPETRAVQLVRCGAAELFGKAGGGFAGAGKENNSGNGTIKTVDEAEIDFAGLVVFGLDVGFRLIEQIGVAGFIPRDKQAGRFDDREAVIVLEEDFKRDAGAVIREFLRGGTR
ncbi:MAG: hypothetical protein U0903_15455 [Planctomycetales bacterium]